MAHEACPPQGMHLAVLAIFELSKELTLPLTCRMPSLSTQAWVRLSWRTPSCPALHSRRWRTSLALLWATRRPLATLLERSMQRTTHSPRRCVSCCAEVLREQASKQASKQSFAFCHLTLNQPAHLLSWQTNIVLRCPLSDKISLKAMQTHFPCLVLQAVETFITVPQSSMRSYTAIGKASTSEVTKAVPHGSLAYKANRPTHLFGCLHMLLMCRRLFHKMHVSSHRDGPAQRIYSH